MYDLAARLPDRTKRHHLAVRRRQPQLLPKLATRDIDARLKRVNFAMEWPPNSGKSRGFPEVDRAEWFDLHEARRMILPEQTSFVERLEEQLERTGP